MNGLLNTLPSLLDSQLRQQCDVSHSDYVLLSTLAALDPPEARMSRLADLISASASRVSHAVKRMEKAGFVVREGEREDRRASVAKLTKAGKRKVREGEVVTAGFLREAIFAALREEQIAEFNEIGGILMEELAPDSAVAARRRCARRRGQAGRADHADHPGQAPGGE